MGPTERLDIERLGGLAGMGLSQSRIRSRVTLLGKELSAGEQDSVDALFKADASRTRTEQGGADSFRYRLTLHNSQGSREIEVGAGDLRESLEARIKDELI